VFGTNEQTSRNLGDVVGSFLGSSHGFESESLVEFGLRFSAQNSATPVFPDFFGSFVVVSFNGFNQLGEFLFVLVLDFREGDTGALFSADQLSESGFTFDDAVWDVHLSAESWKVDNNLDWVDIVGDDNKLGLFSFDEVDDLVDSAVEGGWSLTWGVWLAFSSCFGSGYESLFFLGFVLWGVLGGQFEQLGGGLFVQGLGELVDGRWDLQSSLENRSLPLELDVGWPSNESGQISFWLDILTDAEVLGSFFEERVGGRLFLASEFLDWGRGHSLTFSYHFLKFVV
jgi:hypothetical protein